MMWRVAAPWPKQRFKNTYLQFLDTEPNILSRDHKCIQVFVKLLDSKKNGACGTFGGKLIIHCFGQN